MAAQLQKNADEMKRKKLPFDASPAELTSSNLVPSKGASSPSDATSCISSVGEAPCSGKGEVDPQHLVTDQGVQYPASGFYGYYYPGYGGSYGDIENQGYYVGADAGELQYHVMQADNGSYVYLMPGYQTGYSSYFPVSTIGADQQYVGQMYPHGPIFEQPIASAGYYSAPLSFGDLMPVPYSFDSYPTTQDGSHGNVYSELAGKPSGKPNLSSQSHSGNLASKPASHSNLSHPLEVKSSAPLKDVSSGHAKHNQIKSLNKAPVGGAIVHSDVIAKGCLPITKFPTYNQGKSGLLYPNNLLNVKSNTKGWVSTEKYKWRSKVGGEQNHGPRTVNAKGTLISGGNPAGTLATDGSGNGDKISLVRMDQYNFPDFPTKYDNALFFVIKSYSEDDIHKSIKYNVWASTPNGNKRLDAAYQEAQKLMAEKGSKCPVFLYFSVNASGQFCGVAEMIGRVDFSKSMDFWQQDKWNGYFPVKWHIIKDIPNPQLRHIILENNDNKPVTNSRDTQEVYYPQGIEMLSIFKNFVARTSILDDFEFYESRQKVMQEKKTRHHMPISNAQMDQLTIALGSVDISAEMNTEEPKAVEQVIAD